MRGALLVGDVGRMGYPSGERGRPPLEIGRRFQCMWIKMTEPVIPRAAVRNKDLVAARRKAILDAAVSILTNKGFSVTRTQEIAARANVTQGTLYNYISTKEDILYLICDEIATARTNALNVALIDGQDPYERLVQVLRSMIGTYFEYPAHAAIVFRETHLLPEPIRNKMRERFAGHIDRVYDVLCEANAAGVCRIDDARLVANMITFLPSVLALRNWYADYIADRDVTTDRMLDFILHGLGVERSAAGAAVPAGKRAAPSGHATRGKRRAATA